MTSNLAPVEPGDSLIVGRTEIQECPCILLRMIRETVPVPYGAFIIVQLRSLRVPVPGDIQRPVGIEVILIQLCPVAVEVIVGKIRGPVSQRGPAVVIVAVLIRVHDCLPEAVERDGLPCLYIYYLGCRQGLSGKGTGREQPCCQQCQYCFPVHAVICLRGSYTKG